MESYTEILSEALKVTTELTKAVQILQEEENQYKKQIYEIKEQLSVLRKANIEKEMEYKELKQNAINFEIENNQVNELQNLYTNLPDLKSDDRDLNKLRRIRTHCAMYQRLLGFQWNCSMMEDEPTLVSGIVFNKNNNHLKMFSFHNTDSPSADTSEKLWEEISSASKVV